MKKEHEKVSDEEIIKELEKNDENKSVEEIFEPNGKMKIDTTTMTEPTLSAKRKTLAICAILVASIIIVAIIFTNESSEPITDESLQTESEDVYFNTQESLSSINEEIISNPNTFISNKGHLYSTVVESNITSNGDEVLYLYKSDVDSASGENSSFSLFVKEKNAQGYTLTDIDNIEYQLTEDQYESLIIKYSNEDEIEYPLFNSADFNEFTFMSAMEMNNQGISTQFVNTRYLAVNGSYGVIICSPKGDDADLHGYIFEKIDGEWTIIVSEYQNIDNYLNYVNNNYGYMDINLLLNMDINKYPKDSFITELDPVVNGMIQSNIITEADLPMSYGVGYDNLMYMEFNSGLAFVGVSDTNGVTTYPVVNTYETKTIFEKFSDDPPYIILKQY